MRTVIGCVCIASLLVSAGCSKKEAGAAPSGSTSTPASGGPAPSCKDDTNKHLQPDGKVQSCLLAADYSTGGYTCSGGKMVELHPSGALKDCYLATEKVVDGWSCKDGLSLRVDGKLRRCKLTQPKSVAPDVQARAGDWITLYPSGSLKRLELAAGPEKIRGLPCKGYLNYFWENGQLKKCELSEAANVGGKPAKAGDFVCFDEKGKPVADCKALTFDMME